MIRCLLIMLLLVGCAQQIPLLRPMHAEMQPFAINGRISILHQGQRDSAGLHWTHQSFNDEILLLTPLGQAVARIYSDAREATLDEGGKHYQAQDVEALMMRVLGWRLQLDGLHHWVLGMKASGDARIERDELGRVAVLYQSGWEVRYLRYADKSANSLPTKIKLTRGKLQLTLLIDEWEWNTK